MKVNLLQLGKRFNRDRIFSGMDYEFPENGACVILGSNGSGKSTLLQIIAGSASPSEGTIVYSNKGQVISPETIFRHTSFASPYLELLEELTLTEHIAFHARLKPLRPEVKAADVAELAGLAHAKNKQIRHFSSGMKQRVRLALAVLSDTSLLLLDEPCSNLDHAAQQWYQNLVNNHSSDRLILVCSNKQEYEYPFCRQQLLMEHYK